MTRSCYEREYLWFNEGDEVFTENVHFKNVSAHKEYTVLKCYKPPGFVKDYPVIMIEIMGDGGYISRYASDRFKKTDRQIRHDKLTGVLDNNI